MTKSEPDADWPVGLIYLSFVVELQQALAWARKAAKPDGRFSLEQMYERLSDVDRLLSALPDRLSPLISMARPIARELAALGNAPLDELGKDLDLLNTQILVELRRELPPPPKNARDWTLRVRRLAQYIWIGGDIWDCPAGWLPIMERAALQMLSCIPRSDLQQFHTSQIKEKFGGLRWYGSGDDRFYAVTGFAELTATYVCQACGREGRLRPERSWLLTLCDAHYALDLAGEREVIGKLSYPMPIDDEQ